MSQACLHLQKNLVHKTRIGHTPSIESIPMRHSPLAFSFTSFALLLQLARSYFLGAESLVTCFALCHLESSHSSLQVRFIECEPNVCLSHSLEISTLSNFWLRTYPYREVVTFCVFPHVILFIPTSQEVCGESRIFNI